MITIIGDLMLDEYCFGNVTRVSPEAPVPILEINKRKLSLGGAANVALNVKGLGADVYLVGVVGDDDEGSVLIELVESENIPHSIIRCYGRRTTKKTRLINRKQHMLRIDQEDTSPITKGTMDRFILPESSDVIVLSDYDKGVLKKYSFVRDIIKNHDKVYVDPKGNNWTKYSGAYCLKPNLKEFMEYTNEPESVRGAQKIRTSLNIQNLIITKGEDGMTLYNNKGSYYINADNKEVFDVCGAGDTVLATLAYHHNENINYAMNQANKAAGVIVGKFGTVAINKKDLAKND